jgi:diguanylate cyclase (GGDEF)-like protein/putative nucleotidyltransferase with HDIG domain
MSKLTPVTKLYILSIIGLGGALTVWQLAQLDWSAVWIVLGVCVLASLAQTLKVEGPTGLSSYNTSWVAYGFAFLLLGAPAAIFVILVSHLVEWVKYRYPWYIQCFNIGQFAIVTSLAGWAHTWINNVVTPASGWEAVAAVGALATFTLANHMLIGVVLRLARKLSFKDSGVFDRLSLVMDFTMLGMGVGAALIWRFNPYASVLAVTPLYLVYSTLRIPALQRQTQLDPKTGLFNAKYFTETLEKELARADRFDRPLTVVVADLDLLRNINNTYGHLAGDAALVAVAGILKKLVREYDVVARFGGEEFAILMPETSLEQAHPRIEELRAAIEAARIDVPTSVNPIRVTMSFGMAKRVRFGQSPNELIHSADLAVYQAKLAGRNRISQFDGTDTENPLTVTPQVGEPASTLPVPPDPVPAISAPTLSPASATAPAPPPLPASAHTPAPAVHLKPRPTWALPVYVASVVAVALGAFVIGYRPTQAVDWIGVACFTVLVFLSEWLAIELYVKDTSVSTAAAPLIAGAMLLGPAAALILSVTLAAAAAIKHRSPMIRFYFNSANHLIASMLAIAVGQSFNFQSDPAAVQLMLMVAASGLAYLSSTWLITIAMDLSMGQSFLHLWMERFRWLWPYYLALGVMAAALAGAYFQYSWVGLLVILVPLLMVRYGQAQYVEHTKGMVTQLRASNTELQGRAEQISALNEELLMALSHAIDLRDPEVHGHSQHVARYAQGIAQCMGLPPERVELVRKAALLHDIGKLGIPESILFKPARLTPAEYESVKQHAALGADIVNNVQSLKALVPFIRHHHERYDGAGYPAQLHDHEIPLEARILSVADTVEAMASDRPYRQGMSAAAIVNEVVDQSGKQFDPLVVNALVKFLHREGEGVVVNSARSMITPVPYEETQMELSPLLQLARQRTYPCRQALDEWDLSPLMMLARQRYLLSHPSTLDVGDVSPLRTLAANRTWAVTVYAGAD